MKKYKRITYTSTLPEDILSQVNDYVEQYNIPKNQVIEEALRMFLMEQDKKTFAEGFKRLAKDPEMMQLAEMGMGEYLDQMKRYERGEV